MKMLKNTCNLWIAILSLISVFSCLTIVGYASEKNDKISVTTETASLITNSQDQIERSLEKVTCLLLMNTNRIQVDLAELLY